MSVQYLDLYNIIVNELVGDPLLFVFIVFLLTAVALARFRTPSQISLLVIYAVALVLSIEFVFLRPFVIIFGLGFTGWMFSRLRRE